MKKSNRPLLAAMLVMSLFALLGATATHAQDANPLVATTGPNVLGQGKMQWNSQFEYLHYELSPFGSPANTTNIFGLGTGLRLGLGGRAELTFGLAGAYGDNSGDGLRNTFGLTPSVGAKLMLFDGRGWLPQVAFFTRVAVPMDQNAYGGEWDCLVRPEIGMQLRNRIGQRWLLDYSLGYCWDRHSSVGDGTGLADRLRYSLSGRWLATDRLMLGLGVGNLNILRHAAADLELRYQASQALQLSLSASAQLGGAGSGSGATHQYHALVGIGWMLK